MSSDVKLFGYSLEFFTAFGIFWCNFWKRLPSFGNTRHLWATFAIFFATFGTFSIFGNFFETFSSFSQLLAFVGKNQEVMQRPERRRREGRCSARFAFARRSSLICVPVLFLYLCWLWVYVFYGFYVGPAKLQCGATPPSVMVLFSFSPGCCNRHCNIVDETLQQLSGGRLYPRPRGPSYKKL